MRTFKDIKRIEIDVDRVGNWLVNILYTDKKTASMLIDDNGSEVDMLDATVDTINRQLAGNQ